MKKQTLLLLGMILLGGALVRLVSLSSNPPGFFPDEAVNGYDAYSLLKTGKDHHGAFMPLIFQSLDDDKTPLHIYAMVPVIAVYGLTVFAVRFSFAVWGILTLIMCFFTTKKLFDEKAALAATLLLALSPWHIHYSRMAVSQATLVPFFTLLSLYFLFSFLHNQKKHLLYFALSLGVGLYSYDVAKLFLPLFFGGALWLYRHDIIKKWKANSNLFWTALCIFLLLLLPILILHLNGKGLARAKSVSILSSEHPLQEGIHTYVMHFSASYLLLVGDPYPRHGSFHTGQFLVAELLLFCVGMYLLKKKNPQLFLLSVWWIILYPLVSSLTNSGVHASRSIVILPLVQIIAGYALVSLWSKRQWLAWLVLLLLVGQSFFFLYDEFVLYPQEARKDWYYGLEDAYAYAMKHAGEYEAVVIEKHIHGSEVMTLFFTRMDPSQYQAHGFNGSSFCAAPYCYLPGKPYLYMARYQDLPGIPYLYATPGHEENIGYKIFDSKQLNEYTKKENLP